MNRKIKPAVFIVFVLVLCGIAVAYFWRARERRRDFIKVSGNIEGDDVRLSFRV